MALRTMPEPTPEKKNPESAFLKTDVFSTGYTRSIKMSYLLFAREG